MNIGQRLFELRKKKNLSQEEVADILGVSRQTISKWETDASTPDFDKIIPICNLYEITSDELLSGIKNEKDEVLDNKINDNNEENKKQKRTLGLVIGIFLYFLAIAWIMVSIPVLSINPILSTALFLIICGIATCIIIYTSAIYKKEKTVKEEKNSKVKTSS